MMDSSFLTI
jgi:carbonic anhydrase